MRQPIKFLPYLKSTERGGEEISRFKDLCINCKTIGESWELSAVPGCESIVMEGDECGMTLADLVRKHKQTLVGESVYGLYGDTFPIVVKLIDIENSLSIQILDHQESYGYQFGAEGKIQPIRIGEEFSDSTDGFKVCHEMIDGNRRITNPDDSFMGIICVEGSGEMKVDGISSTVKKGQTLLLPAKTEAFDVQGTMSLLTVVISTLITA